MSKDIWYRLRIADFYERTKMIIFKNKDIYIWKVYLLLL